MPIDVEAVVGREIDAIEFSWQQRDAILYALGAGIGVGVDQTDANVLKYTYEKDLKVLPTFGVVPAFPAMIAVFSAPGFDINPMMILHGEQSTEILCDQIPTSADTVTKSKVVNVFDKGKGALVILESLTSTKDGKDLFKNRFSIFIRGEGGFGGDSGPKPEDDAPDRAPDKTLEYKTLTHQAIIYRLSGDYNPLHVDPEFAAFGDLDKPILHGLCTYANLCRGVIDGACDSEPERLRYLKARFAAPVLPGETIAVDLWKQADNDYIVRARVLERDIEVVKNARALLR